ncbi:sulfotransferase domain-containing protein [Subsaxibacter sp. CAU 1640]|uniref:sulfotransferase domain-containing protein n=1 Tax=Subsaxibacter sp. CAU 1640 TaxID=2933271 RepID=UPI002002C5B2|nr:sulfotransferase domain-containing protein [Subsaxibacter sp. CAU 1640]MCK7590231.1 sulfotransferase domain-containing protein [Subsaxibacter sp. CAU 1640]
MSNFPDYIIIGAAKCGTTSLCNYLGVHPKVKMTQPKELDFFGREGIEEKLEDYCEHFKDKNGILTGEGSVSYMMYSELAALQIKTYAPEVKIIAMLRNPADRFYSDFWFNINRGAIVYKKGMFDGVIDNTMHVPYSPVHKMSYRDSLITKGMYAEHLKHYYKHFNKDQIKVIFFEDFTKDSTKVLNSVFEFLGLSETQIEAPPKVYNKTMYPGKLNVVYVAWKHVKPYLPNQFVMNQRARLSKLKDFFFTEKKAEFSAKSRAKLISIYADSIAELETMLDKDLSHWKK